MVTGSLIRSPNITADSPLTTVQRAEVKLEGTTTIENLVNNLPQATGGQNLGQSINSTGTANVSLRNLGAQRTLVLVDGRRLNPGDPTQQAPGADLNEIPAQMVERVDVVTGGASATYGADAVAGVVNFVTRKNFQGVEIDVQASANEDDAHSKFVDQLLQTSTPTYNVPGDRFDGAQYTASFIAGSNVSDGRGNVTVYGSYFHSASVLQPTRDYSSCALGSTASGNTHGLPGKTSVYDTYFCVGSTTSAYGKFTPESPFSTGGTQLHDNPDGTSTFVTTSVPGFNFNANSYIQREDDRYSLGYFAHYQVDPHVELYSDFMFLRDATTAQYGPTGLFAGTTNVPFVSTFNINCNNPLLSAQQQGALCGPNAGTPTLEKTEIGYRFLATGPRSSNFIHDNYRVVVGGRGDLSDAWSYDAYLQYGHVDFQESENGFASLARVANALLVDPTTGQCTSGGSCVPLNIFQANSAGVTPAALNYLRASGLISGGVTEQVADITVNGNLGKYGVKSPYASDGISAAFGSQYRRENLVFTPDEENLTGDLAGNSVITAAQGTFDVYELFAELHVPVVQNLPFAKAITFNPGYRFSDYSSIGTTSTYKLDADWAVTRDVRFRYSYNVATRAPNITELYTPDAELLYAGSDPCSGSHPQASLAACQAQGVTAAQYGTIANCPAGQCSTLTGQNTSVALKPETAKTYTYGVVLTPSFLPRLSLSIDYYNIRISDLISEGLGGAAAEVEGCDNTQAAAFCSLIHRDPATGELYGAGYVSAVNQNEGFIQTKGVDFDLAYSYPISGFGRLGLDFEGTFVQHYVTEPFGADPSQGLAASGTYDCAGLYGVTCGVPTPHFRSKTRLTWNTPWGLVLSGQWRFIEGTDVDINTGNALLTAGSTFEDLIDRRIPNVSYFDFTAQYKFKDRYTFRAGCNNLLDKQPPIGDANNEAPFGQGNGNTFPQLYDTLGRNIFVGLTADF